MIVWHLLSTTKNVQALIWISPSVKSVAKVPNIGGLFPVKDCITRSDCPRD